MTEKLIDKGRRQAMKLAAGSVIAIPLGGILAGNAIAADLPPVAADDPQGAALKYVADATKGERVDKAGTPAAEQFCHNCQLAQSTEGDLLPCQLFPGKSVATNGWCSAWVKRAS